MGEAFGVEAGGVGGGVVVGGEGIGGGGRGGHAVGGEGFDWFFGFCEVVGAPDGVAAIQCAVFRPDDDVVDCGCEIIAFEAVRQRLPELQIDFADVDAGCGKRVCD